MSVGRGITTKESKGRGKKRSGLRLEKGYRWKKKNERE